MADESAGPFTGEEYRAAIASMLARLESLEAQGVKAHEADAKWRAEETERMKQGHAEAIARQDALGLERIRDGFAASALEGMLAKGFDARDLDGAAALPFAYAKRAYLCADAMMAARKP
jgi:hypothetical protein